MHAVAPESTASWCCFSTPCGTFALSLRRPVEVGIATDVRQVTGERGLGMLGRATVRGKAVAVFSLGNLIVGGEEHLQTGDQVVIVHYGSVPLGYRVGADIRVLTPRNLRPVPLPRIAYPGGQYPPGLGEALIIEGKIVLTIDLDQLVTPELLGFADRLFRGVGEP